MNMKNMLHEDLMCLRLQKLPRPDVFLTRGEALKKLEDGTLKVGDAYGYNLPFDTWLTVTSVADCGFTAHDQIGGSESVEMVAE